MEHANKLSLQGWSQHGRFQNASCDYCNSCLSDKYCLLFKKIFNFCIVWIDRSICFYIPKYCIISKNCVMFSRWKNWTPTIMLLKNEWGSRTANRENSSRWLVIVHSRERFLGKKKNPYTPIMGSSMYYVSNILGLLGGFRKRQLLLTLKYVQ